MKQVKLHDKVFQVSIPEAQILRAVKHVADQLNQDLEGEDKPLFISVLNGSFLFTADLMRNIDIPCEISFLKLTSYQGTKSTGKVQELIGLNDSIEGRTVIVLEDIVDSGNTLETLTRLINAYKPKRLKIASLLYKPEAYKKDIKIDYIGISIPNDFIVGYGLDYDGLGRNLRDIYTVV